VRGAASVDVRFGAHRGLTSDIARGPKSAKETFQYAELSLIKAWHSARPTPENHTKALKTIPQVKVPSTDPMLGQQGGLLKLRKRG
jgi:hypothetical protein